jgi:hypothetical protein
MQTPAHCQSFCYPHREVATTTAILRKRRVRLRACLWNILQQPFVERHLKCFLFLCRELLAIDPFANDFFALFLEF